MTNDSTRVKPPDLGDDPDWYYDIRDDIDDSISYLSEELNHISPADASVTFWLLHLHYNAYYEKRHQDTPALLAALIGDVLETRGKYEGENALPWFEVYCTTNALYHIYDDKKYDKEFTSDRAEQWTDTPTHIEPTCFNTGSPTEREFDKLLSEVTDTLETADDLDYTAMFHLASVTRSYAKRFAGQAEKTHWSVGGRFELHQKITRTLEAANERDENPIPWYDCIKALHHVSEWAELKTREACAAAGMGTDMASAPDFTKL